MVIENITHHHVNPYDETLNPEERCHWISAEVMEFLGELFADRVRFGPSAANKRRERTAEKPAVGQIALAMRKLNELATRTWAALSARYPTWALYLDSRAEDDLEVAIPSPAGSRAGHLVVFTNGGKDVWVRFSPPSMCYAVDDEQELFQIIDQLLSGKASFVTTWRGDQWTGTTLIKAGHQPNLEPGEIAHVVSWNGSDDRVVGPTGRSETLNVEPSRPI